MQFLLQMVNINTRIIEDDLHFSLEYLFPSLTFSQQTLPPTLLLELL